ncbi:hypothetical protein VB834_16985 [Limnoraphis robusta Tam1]|uniref:Uncharacterized protein n=1 Tax=Limnoraphis robusta CCNP1315 TaxID=3110306 RepID=A0ABU5TYB1_9CYAN|nr:hypothetical protein [Limnoraphis robusta]MEA5495911.1 hypothetical protein [Limnoraphis robusta BA-68 BA1]MEA5519939.1 hypothetical protein [Limnoraphis robusta CCNP1315]MEA5540716.1 hypothetical protein [Limnoraphis robusta Tam1]MEA5544955.1 hypothetical protein [Limnoraphis robusta CCNP1324]
MTLFSGLAFGFVAVAKPPIFSSAILQGFAQLQESRMPLRQAIIGKFFITAVVAELVEKGRAHFGRFGIAVDVAQGIQCPVFVAGGKPFCKIALFPKRLEYQPVGRCGVGDFR